jgi:hypothetical protein
MLPHLSAILQWQEGCFTQNHPATEEYRDIKYYTDTPPFALDARLISLSICPKYVRGEKD